MLTDEAENEYYRRIMLYVTGNINELLAHLMGSVENAQELALLYQALHSVFSHHIGMVEKGLASVNNMNELKKPLADLEKLLQANLDKHRKEGFEHAASHEEHHKHGSCKNCRH